MATLILEQADRRRGGVLNGRVVIGRRAHSHIAIRDRSVSRIHAWIGYSDAGYFIADSGSRTGTKINGQWMRGRRPLQDGDRIRIGPARITFHTDGDLPPDIEPLDLSDRPLQGSDGIFLDCACGAPIWVPWEYAGKAGKCRDCDRLVQLPRKPDADAGADMSNDTMFPGMSIDIARGTAGTMLVETTEAPPEPAGPFLDEDEAAPRTDPEHARHAPETLCGACQSAISMLEETTHCPECGVVFHTDCWIQNAGCSSYGCKQVGILSPTPSSPTVELPEPGIDATSPPSYEPVSHQATAARKIQWGYLLLPASVLIGLASVLAFGGPSLLLAIGVVVYGIRRPVQNRKVSGVVVIISLIAAAAGSGFSTYWWLAAPAGGGLRP
jgi:hypothetical protein